MKRLVVWVFLLGWLPASACTVFTIDEGQDLLLAKNFDWPLGIGFVIYNPAGQTKTAPGSQCAQPLRWEARYASITLNHLGKELALGGLNSAGLVVEEASAPVGMSDEGEEPALNELQFVQYLLDSFKSVEEVLAALPSIPVRRLLFRLHYYLADAYGQQAILEFDGNKMSVYKDNSLPIPVLSNNRYTNTLRYVQLRPQNSYLHRNGSQERFYRVMQLLERTKGRVTKPELRAFSILDSVRQKDTRWQVVYGPRTKNIQVRSDGSKRTYSFHLSDTIFAQSGSCRYLALPIPAGALWHTLSLTQNRNLLKDVIQRYAARPGLLSNHAFIKLEFIFQSCTNWF